MRSLNAGAEQSRITPSRSDARSEARSSCDLRLGIAGLAFRAIDGLHAPHRELEFVGHRIGECDDFLGIAGERVECVLLGIVSGSETLDNFQQPLYAHLDAN